MSQNISPDLQEMINALLDTTEHLARILTQFKALEAENERLRAQITESTSSAYATQTRLNPNLVHALLRLAGAYVDIPTIHAWTDEQRMAATSWACLSHLHSSDPAVVAPPTPSFIKLA